MPNGTPQFLEQELPTLEAFFSEISDVLKKFAEDFNLKIDQYWHQMPSWRFSFKHPKDGIACIEVMKESVTAIKIYSYWWIDDFEMVQGIRVPLRQMCLSWMTLSFATYSKIH
jgi:hypothetical protein